MKLPTTSLFCLVGFIFPISSFLKASPMEVKSVQRNQTGVTMQMDAGVLQLQVCGGRTIHVLYSPSGNLPKVPTGFAVQKQPDPGAFDLTGAGDTVALTTAQCSVQVDKKTGALTFLGHDGKPYLRETPTGGKILTPATVAGIQTNTVDQTFVLDPTEGLYGLGQHPTGVMDYVGTTVHLEQQNMDTAVPVLISSKGYGVFWNNPAITDVTISPASQANPTVEWKSESGNKIDYYVFYGPDLDQVIADYRELTGAVPMFGRWAWGFWQCKEHYATQQELLDVAAKYRQMKVPIDGIIQDWFYWDPHPWGSHQFDANRYPDPAALTRTLHAEDIHIIISVWAKFAPGSKNVQALQQAGDLLGSTDPDARKKEQFYDPFKPAARKLYWDQMNRELFADGFDGWWLDASEPELNSNWGEFRDYKTAAGPAAAVYNAYPLMHTSGVYQGMRAAHPSKRVFILTRSAYAGQQRNAAVTWSGDLQGTWDVFKKQIPDGLNFTYSGIPYWNTDTGGFFGGDPQDPSYAELFTRWYQFSAFCPMFRVHGTRQPKEMWRFPDATEKILIDYDKLRYHLLPYIYSVAWKVTHENYTMMRGLVMDFPHDPKVVTITDQYMFGPALLINPVTKPMFAPPAFEIPSSLWIDSESQPGALTGTYFDGNNFDRRKVRRRDGAISFNWDNSPPDPQLPRTNFSARWEGSLQTLGAGEYTFVMSADDGMRLWIDGKMVIEDWNARPVATRVAKVNLPANTRVPVKIEYFQNTGDATIDLKWVPPGSAPWNPTRDVYLPAQSAWVDFWTGETVAGGQTIQAPAPIEHSPVYVRAGSIIPYGPDVQNAMVPEDPIELRVYRGADGAFTLYEDENDNYDYEKGVYATIPFTWDDKKQVLTIGARNGHFPGMLSKRTFRVVWVSPNHGVGLENTAVPDKVISYDGTAATISAQ